MSASSEKRLTARETSRLLMPAEVAEELNVPTRQVYRLLKQRMLQGMRVGRLIRIRRDDLNQFIQSQLERGI